MDFWAAAMADRPVEEFPIPGNVVFVPVDEMGRPGAPGAPGVQMEAFVAGHRAAGRRPDQLARSRSERGRLAALRGPVPPQRAGR